MRVLHTYSPKSSMIAQYIGLFMEDKRFDVDSSDDAKTIKQRCMQFQPDIIHQHGCDAPEVTKASLWARQQGIRIVVTPHGQLESWETVGKMWRKTQLEALVSAAYTVIARSSFEEKELHLLGWNHRVEVIRNPIVTRTVNIEQLLEAHSKVYQQVMDSNVLELMDEPTQAALKTLIKAGITGDERWVQPFDPAEVNWRLLLIYAQHEGITDYVERGMLTMRLPDAPHPAANSYLPPHYKVPETMAGKSVADIVRHIRLSSEKNQLSLLSIVELDQALRRDDVDDNLLMQQLKSERLDTFFAALLQVLNEQTGLDEGFMPCQPAKGQEVERIRDSIKKFLEI